MEFGKCVAERCEDDDIDRSGDESTTYTQPKTTKKTSCTILTGFLGSGKTTLLNHILKSKQHNLKIAVIENEYGEVGVDDALLEIETEEEIFEMNNGCICCTVRGDLMRILHKLSERNHGNTKAFDHIIIETTGLADPAPVAQTFFVDEDISANYELDAILTVVDAKHVLQHLLEIKSDGVENETIEQIAFADKVLLNKIDLVSEDEKEIVKQEIRKVNQFVDIYETTYGRGPDDLLSSLLNIQAFDLDKVLQKEDNFLDINAEHEHDASISSVGIEFQGELDLYKLNTWLTILLRDNGVNIFRSKGILNIHNAPGDARYVFQGVHMLMSISSSDDGVGRPWKPEEPRLNRLIFIGRDLNRDLLTSKFQECVVTV